MAGKINRVLLIVQHSVRKPRHKDEAVWAPLSALLFIRVLTFSKQLLCADPRSSTTRLLLDDGSLSCQGKDYPS